MKTVGFGGVQSEDYMFYIGKLLCLMGYKTVLIIAKSIFEGCELPTFDKYDDRVKRLCPDFLLIQTGYSAKNLCKCDYRFIVTDGFPGNARKIRDYLGTAVDSETLFILRDLYGNEGKYILPIFYKEKAEILEIPLNMKDVKIRARLQEGENIRLNSISRQLKDSVIRIISHLKIEGEESPYRLMGKEKTIKWDKLWPLETTEIPIQE